MGSLTSCPGRVNQSNLMLRRDSPVPGSDTDARTPDSLALSVTWNGPSLIDLVNDLIPCSVILNPAIVLSKLMGDLGLVIKQPPARRQWRGSRSG